MGQLRYGAFQLDNGGPGTYPLAPEHLLATSLVSHTSRTCKNMVVKGECRSLPDVPVFLALCIDEQTWTQHGLKPNSTR